MTIPQIAASTLRLLSGNNDSVATLLSSYPDWCDDVLNAINGAMQELWSLDETPTAWKRKPWAGLVREPATISLAVEYGKTRLYGAVITLTGAGTSAANTTYTATSMNNGKPDFVNGVKRVYWDATGAWIVTGGGIPYYVADGDDVFHPSLISAWTDGTQPYPTVTETLPFSDWMDGCTLEIPGDITKYNRLRKIGSQWHLDVPFGGTSTVATATVYHDCLHLEDPADWPAASVRRIIGLIGRPTLVGTGTLTARNSLTDLYRMEGYRQNDFEYYEQFHQDYGFLKTVGIPRSYYSGLLADNHDQSAADVPLLYLHPLPAQGYAIEGTALRSPRHFVTADLTDDTVSPPIPGTWAEFHLLPRVKQWLMTSGAWEPKPAQAAEISRQVAASNRSLKNTNPQKKRNMRILPTR